MNKVEIMFDGENFLLLTLDGWKEYRAYGLPELPHELIKKVEEIFGLNEE
jgi:hypothetical protein